MCKVLEEKQMAGNNHRPRKAVRRQLNGVGQHRLITRVLGTWNCHLVKDCGDSVALAAQTRGKGRGSGYVPVLLLADAAISTIAK